MKLADFTIFIFSFSRVFSQQPNGLWRIYVLLDISTVVGPMFDLWLQWFYIYIYIYLNAGFLVCDFGLCWFRGSITWKWNWIFYNLILIIKEIIGVLFHDYICSWCLMGIGGGDSGSEIGFLCPRFVKAILRFRIFLNFQEIVSRL